MEKAIIITGTPGTGKTTLSKELSLLLKNKVINTSDFAKKKDLLEKNCKKDDIYEVDIKKLTLFLKEEIKKSKKPLIIEGHMSHFLPKKYVKFCFICKTGLKTLKKRLTSRKYNKDKIKENLECEIFDICLMEAKEKNYNIEIIDTNKTLKKNIEKIKQVIIKNQLK